MIPFVGFKFFEKVVYQEIKSVPVMPFAVMRVPSALS
jgi:hypothetical protein